VSDLARLNHENVAKLIGYCKEYDPFSRMLVFEYASNGTLYEHLHGNVQKIHSSKSKN
jgi:serine/threonine protein kinase